MAVPTEEYSPTTILVPTKASLETAVRSLRKKTQSQQIIQEARRRAYYEKPSEFIFRKSQESLQKRRKLNNRGYPPKMQQNIDKK